MFTPRAALVLLAFSLLVAPSGLAADPSADLLGARHVKDSVRLMVRTENGKDVVVGAIDSASEFHAIDGKTLAADGQINIYVADFNPLKQVWTIESVSSVDPSYDSIKKFLDDLKPLQEALPKTEAAGDQAAEMSRTLRVMAQRNNAGVAEAQQEEDECGRLRDLIKKANQSLKEPGFAAADLDPIVAKATGNLGVLAAKSDLEKVVEKIKKANDEARQALQDIRDDFGHPAGGGDPAKACAVISADILVDYIFATGNAERIIAARAGIAASIEDLIKKSLVPYADPTKWRAASGTSLTDLVFTTVEPTFENQMTVTSTMKKKAIDVSSNAVSATTSEGADAEFLVRRDSFWVPERAAAMIYNRITYPKWGTIKNDKGELVAHREDDTQPVGAAMMLNLIPRFSRGSAVYPMLQIGVSSAKEFPGFLAGVGIRFTAPVAFSISAGGMITRFKDLDKNLHEGSPVTGTSDIDKHLVYKTSPIALYGALQLKF